jgi:glycosyltransferase involved in cell wall biosynthesis
MKPLFSVMMICYNNVQFIKAAIDSVKAQTYDNWELVINDDCSTDGTYELAQKLAESDERIRVYQNEKNLMTPSNRAAASKHLLGDLVGHLDADDMFYPHAIEYMVKTFNDNPDVALVYSDTAGINAKGKITCYNLHTDADTNLAHFGWRHFGAYRMSVFKETEGYNTKLTGGCEDGDLFMQIVETRKFMRVPHVLYYHRSHDSNTSPKNHSCGTCPDRPVCNYIRVWCKHAKFDHITFKPLETK